MVCYFYQNQMSSITVLKQNKSNKQTTPNQKNFGQPSVCGLNTAVLSTMQPPAVLLIGPHSSPLLAFRAGYTTCEKPPCYVAL